MHLVPDVKEALDAFVAAGLMAAEHDEEFGGMQLPIVVAKAAFAYFKGANVASSGYARARHSSRYAPIGASILPMA